MTTTPPSPAAAASAAASAAPQILLRRGDLLAGRYRIEGVVQARRAGVRFSATELTTGAPVAVHMLTASGVIGILDGDGARASFLSGARRAKGLSSPHVARVLDAGMTLEGHPWMVGEHIASPPLTTHLRLGPTAPSRSRSRSDEPLRLIPTEAVDIALSVCDALAELHGSGMIHGSLGPHAVHVAWSSSGRPIDVKLTGAGTAAAEAALALGGGGDVECILRAPEQLRHAGTIDERADVWALGVLLHTMLSGRSPFGWDTPSGASLSVILDEPPSLADVPEALAALIKQSLARAPGERPSSALELAEALAPFASCPDAARARIARRRRSVPRRRGYAKKPSTTRSARSARKARSAVTVLTRPRSSLSQRANTYVAGLVALVAVLLVAFAGVRTLPALRPSAWVQSSGPNAASAVKASPDPIVDVLPPILVLPDRETAPAPGLPRLPPDRADPRAAKRGKSENAASGSGLRATAMVRSPHGSDPSPRHPVHPSNERDDGVLP